ncbi:expressed unknown protein [Seminavis robusta]|uniref:Uncharacterized protein n=1 Tax=Seminavis robusta TaxID=568900 RepID=A0A9N8EWK9_9STRA|nr:expressed unknown protein [Seminavis robusta]|eukprot:Sro1906_g304660.1 n/a (158) ;mRNA; r:20005-20558
MSKRPAKRTRHEEPDINQVAVALAHMAVTEQTEVEALRAEIEQCKAEAAKYNEVAGHFRRINQWQKDYTDAYSADRDNWQILFACMKEEQGDPGCLQVTLPFALAEIEKEIENGSYPRLLLNFSDSAYEEIKGMCERNGWISKVEAAEDDQENVQEE